MIQLPKIIVIDKGVINHKIQTENHFIHQKTLKDLSKFQDVKGN